MLFRSNPTNRVNYFNRKMPGSHFFYVGDDDGGVQSNDSWSVLAPLNTLKIFRKKKKERANPAEAKSEAKCRCH